MGIRVLEIHHHAVRIDSEPPKLEAVQKFYKDVLGLEADPGRPKIPGVPGFWINVGEGGQIHLIGGEQPSPLAKGPGQDPTIPHVALAVADIKETKAELDRLNVPYWSMTRSMDPLPSRSSSTTQAGTWSSYIRLTNAAAVSLTASDRSFYDLASCVGS
jgi:catechol 2,3-dioxygenase-like lactoylglutathione lyase family enzyme